MIRRLERELALLPEEIRWLEDFTGEFGVPELLRGHRDEVGLLALVYVLNLSGEVELLGPKKAKMASRDPAQIDADRVSDRLRLAREALSVETTAQAVLKASFQNQIFMMGQ